MHRWRWTYASGLAAGTVLALFMAACTQETSSSEGKAVGQKQTTYAAAQEDAAFGAATPKPKRPVRNETFPEDPKATWTTTRSNVRWRDAVVGNGAEVTSGAIAYFHIKTFLHDGQLFHSTLVDRKPVCTAIGIGRLQREFEEALIGMREHGRRLIVFPQGLSYWSAAHLADGPALPPGESPKFEVTCLIVKSGRPATREEEASSSSSTTSERKEVN